VKLCSECSKLGISTQVEKYRESPLECCTFHYWLMRGRPLFSLEVYVKSSERNGFVTSLPTQEEMQRMTTEGASKTRSME
jgi:hypothetical protein